MSSSPDYANCTQVTPACPVEGTLYGYTPNLGGNVFFLMVFACMVLLQIPLLYFYRLWSFSCVLAAGALMEVVGYVGRIRMHYNPWNDSAFTMQITCLILAPSLIAASIYLTFKHLIISFGPGHSRLKPRLYTWIFIGCDVFSIFLQAAGGGVASSDDPSKASTGNNIMICGIAFQVVTMGVCGILAVDFAITYRKRNNSAAFRISTIHWNSLPRRTIFCATSALAYTVILIRCIYRLPEMAGGWGNGLMRNEPEFLALDGFMVALGVSTLTLSYPGYMVPGMMKSSNKADAAAVPLV